MRALGIRLTPVQEQALPWPRAAARCGGEIWWRGVGSRRRRRGGRCSGLRVSEHRDLTDHHGPKPAACQNGRIAPVTKSIDHYLYYYDPEKCKGEQVLTTRRPGWSIGGGAKATPRRRQLGECPQDLDGQAERDFELAARLLRQR